MKDNVVDAKFVQEITVIDPDTLAEVQVCIYKEQGGGMFGVDSSFLENTNEKVYSPFGNGVISDDSFA